MHRHFKRRRNKQRNIIIISACSILLLMTVGYAAMNTNLEINAKGNVIEKNTLGKDLIDMAGVVTNGDGLYKDAYEENIYTYRGANPNNYVNFNEEQWRIISVNASDNTIKIMRHSLLSDRVFDTNNNGRYDGQYCNDSSYGCNIYGSNSTLYDVNLNPITTLGRQYNGTKYQLPSKESEISIYLNGTYYNGLTTEARRMIKEDAMYKVGVLNYNNTSMSQDMEQVNATKWKGKVALIDATEYVRASTNSNCTRVYAFIYNSNCYNNSNSHNWMYNSNSWWTISPYSSVSTYYIWYVGSSGAFLDYNGFHGDSNDRDGVRPVVTLSPEVKITSGDGSQNNSYNLSI